MKRAVAGSFAVLLTVLFAANAAAQDYPGKLIHIVVPFPIGDGYDFMARNIGQKLLESWGQGVLIENRAGANGNLGSDFVAKSPPDGTTLLLGGIGPQALSVALYSRLPYDPMKDFTPVSLVAVQPNLLFVHSSLPVKTVKDLIAFTKTRPGQMTFGSPGAGSGQHFGLEQMRLLTGISLVHMPYQGTAPLHAAQMTGEVSVAFNIIQRLQAASGRLRVLAIASTRRSPLAPDIPTLAELGYPVDFDNWYGLYAPAGTPREFVARLNTEVGRILTLPDVKERAAGLGIELTGTSPERLSAHMQAEITRWVKVAREAGIKIE